MAVLPVKTCSILLVRPQRNQRGDVTVCDPGATLGAILASQWSQLLIPKRAMAEFRIMTAEIIRSGTN